MQEHQAQAQHQSSDMARKRTGKQMQPESAHTRPIALQAASTHPGITMSMGKRASGRPPDSLDTGNDREMQDQPWICPWPEAYPIIDDDEDPDEHGVFGDGHSASSLGDNADHDDHGDAFPRPGQWYEAYPEVGPSEEYEDH